MEMNNGFWKDVYEKSRQRVRQELGTRGEIVKLLILILFSVFGFGLATMLGLSKVLNIQPNYVEIAWWLFGGNLAIVIVLLIVEPVIAFFRMFGLAAEINLRLLDIQETLVARLESKNADLLVTTEINQQDWVGIRVLNGESQLIEGVIKVEAIPESSSFSDSLELKRHGLRGVDLFQLYTNAHNDFDLAIITKSGNARVGIPYHGGQNFFELSPGAYSVETHLTGQFKDPPYGSIIPKIEHWKLIYNQGTNPILQLIKVEVNKQL